tara:strand:+ start:4435 stop:4572 length:138 start_codon:yes stop_codon:yes gene_type:complete
MAKHKPWTDEAKRRVKNKHKIANAKKIMAQRLRDKLEKNKNKKLT